MHFKRHIEEEARDLGGEAFSRFMDNFYHRINTLIESPEVSDNLGALRAIYELIDMKLGEKASKLSRFAEYLRHTFEEKQDPDVLLTASRVLGHFAHVGGTTMADEVERQVCIYFLSSFEYNLQVFGTREPCLGVLNHDHCKYLFYWSSLRVVSL